MPTVQSAFFYFNPNCFAMRRAFFTPLGFLLYLFSTTASICSFLIFIISLLLLKINVYLFVLIV